MSAQNDYITVEPQEPIAEHPSKDGDVAATCTVGAVGDATRSVRVDLEALQGAVEMDLEDSYDDVWVHCDANTVALTDHKKPIDPVGALFLGHVPESVDIKRVESIATAETVPRTLVSREVLSEALAELDAESVVVHVEQDRPLVIRGDGPEGVVIAPRVVTDDIGGEAR